VGLDESLDSSLVVRRLVGLQGKNMKEIMASAPGAKLWVSGRGYGNRQDKTGPLAVCVGTASATVLETALRLVETLLGTVLKGQRGLRQPNLCPAAKVEVAETTANMQVAGSHGNSQCALPSDVVVEDVKSTGRIDESSVEFSLLDGATDSVQHHTSATCTRSSRSGDHIGPSPKRPTEVAFRDRSLNTNHGFLHFRKVEVGLDESLGSSLVVRRLVGVQGKNMKDIMASAPGAKVWVAGRGFGNRQDKTGPLAVCVGAASTTVLETALRLVETLLGTELNGQRGLRQPNLCPAAEVEVIETTATMQVAGSLGNKKRSLPSDVVVDSTGRIDDSSAEVSMLEGGTVSVQHHTLATCTRSRSSSAEAEAEAEGVKIPAASDMLGFGSDCAVVNDSEIKDAKGRDLDVDGPAQRVRTNFADSPDQGHEYVEPSTKVEGSITDGPWPSLLTQGVTHPVARQEPTTRNKHLGSPCINLAGIGNGKGSGTGVEGGGCGGGRISACRVTVAVGKLVSTSAKPPPAVCPRRGLAPGYDFHFFRKIEVGIEEEHPFSVVSRIVGPCGKNINGIMAEAPGSKVWLSGRGSNDSYDKTGPLFVCIGAASASVLEKGAHLVEACLAKVLEAHRRFMQSRRCPPLQVEVAAAPTAVATATAFTIEKGAAAAAAAEAAASAAAAAAPAEPASASAQAVPKAAPAAAGGCNAAAVAAATAASAALPAARVEADAVGACRVSGTSVTAGA